ncbi:MAG: hypothetical protein RI894_203 [Bacteroidota bacterium]
MEYNTEKEKIHIAEYGRNIQNLLMLANTYEDRAYRTAYVESVLEMMYLLNPQVKIVEDYRNKLWSHAFKITEYQLDVDVPEGVTIATREEDDFFHKRPLPLPYPQKTTKHRHYGMHLMRMIEKASTMPDDAKRDEFTLLIATFMKMAQRTYNREGISDEHIRKDLLMLSNGRLVIDENMKIKDILAAKNTQVPPSMSKNAQKNQVKANSIDKEKQEQAKKMLSTTNKLPQEKPQPQIKPQVQAKPKVVQVAQNQAVSNQVVSNQAVSNQATLVFEEIEPTATPKKRRRGGVKHKKKV